MSVCGLGCAMDVSLVDAAAISDAEPVEIEGKNLLPYVTKNCDEPDSRDCPSRYNPASGSAGGINMKTVSIDDNQALEISVWTGPIPWAAQSEFIELWQTEWDKTDFDWLASMKGDYSENLTICSALGRVAGRAVSTALVCHACQDAEVAVVGSVLTHPEFRRRGFAEKLTNAVVDCAWDAGCRVCYLGAARSPDSVYLRCGFQWWNHGVMRRAKEDGDDCEASFFAPGQQTLVRAANWGDLAGMACLAIQPLSSLVLDYPRGLLSGKYVDLIRCVSNFPTVRYEVDERGGALCMLVGDAANRVLGFGSLTPGPGSGRAHTAVLDLATHDHYENAADSIIEFLMDEARQRGIENVQAFVASQDETKKAWLENAGMQVVATLPDEIRVQARTIDVLVLERHVAAG